VGQGGVLGVNEGEGGRALAQVLTAIHRLQQPQSLCDTQQWSGQQWP
jgi:hypothetical protein